MNTTTALRIAIAGPNGRMGQALLAQIDADATVSLSGTLLRPDGDSQYAAKVNALLDVTDVVIDFTNGHASADLAELCAAHDKVAMVIGSTGFEKEHEARIAQAARKILIVRSGNYSLGVNMLMGLVRQAARSLPAENWDIEVLEAHHKRKIDAPSGTALMLGQAAADGREVSLDDVSDRGRDGITGARKAGDIGFASLRGGAIVGEHSVMFAAEDEILTLSHSARDRGMFARGAIVAARWTVGRPAGEYDMQDVLGMK